MFDSLLQMYPVLETYGKDKILWKWQTTVQKIYVLVVLGLYFYKIRTGCLCLKSVIFSGIVFSESLLEIVKKPYIFHKEERHLTIKTSDKTLLNNIVKVKNDKKLQKAKNDDVSTLTKRHYQVKNVYKNKFYKY